MTNRGLKWGKSLEVGAEKVKRIGVEQKWGTERKRECPKEGCVPRNYPSIKNK